MEELVDHHLIITLKGHFFDLLEIENDSIEYSHLLSGMLGTVKNLTKANEVSLYMCKEMNSQVFLEASTNMAIHDITPIRIPFFLNPENWNAGRRVIRDPIPVPELEAHDLLLPLTKSNKLLGILALTGKREELFDLCPDSILEAIGKECTGFINKAKRITQMKEKRYKQLFRVTEKFHSTMDMDAVLGEIISTLREVYPAFIYFLFLSHDNHRDGDLPIKDLEYNSENIAAMQAFVTGIVQIEDCLQEKNSILYAPLKGKQGVYGVLQVIAPDALVFPKSEIEFITLLAHTAGSALENAQLYQQSRRLISDLQLINVTSHQLNSNLRLSETISYMCEQILNSFHAEEVGFILLSNDERKYRVLQESTDFFLSLEAMIYIHYIGNKILKDNDSLFFGDLAFSDGGIQGRFRSVMAVPMTQSGTLKGFSIVMHQEPYHFSFETFKLLQSLIHHSTLAFTNSMLREELEKMVVTDYLTKLYSRNFLDERIQQSMAEDEQGTFVLIDIDNFKMVNDTFGHQTGDEVIIQVSKVINANIRGSDIASRWGGEELAIYLPMVPIETGVKIAERIVRKVEESTEPRVTISCGVSHWDTERKVSVKNLFKRADQALYAAKGSGKNKVVIQKDPGQD